MLSYFRKLPLNKTLYVSAICALVLDILSSLYFVEYWKGQGLSERFVSLALIAQGGSLSDFDPHILGELKQVIDHTAGFMLLCFLFVNTIFYSYLAFSKKWAWQYSFTYTSTAALLCLLTAFERPHVPLFFTVFNLLAIFFYALLSFVLWSRKVEVVGVGFKVKKSEQ